MMKQLKSRIPLEWMSFTIGLLCLCLGWFLTMPVPVLAQEEVPTAEYVGLRECSSCHRTLASNHANSKHNLALFQAADAPEAVLGDFSQSNPLLVLTLPNEEASRQVSLNDVAYVVGAGTHVQRYLVASAENQYTVLPIEWNTATAAWQSLELAATWPSPEYDWNANCAYCHTTGYAAATSTWVDDGVQCEACHGAGSIHLEVADDVEFVEEAEDLAAIQASINPAVDGQVCGQCHSRGTSNTGQVFPDSYSVGTDLLANYSLTPMNDAAHWWTSGHANQTNMQFNEWLNSGHATAYSDLPADSRSNPLCLDCHSEAYRRALRLAENEDTDVLPDPILEAERLPFGVTCNSCHLPHDEAVAEPMLRDTADALCADCHNNGALEEVHHPTVEMLEGITVVEEVQGVTSAHTTAENAPTCTSCHMMTVPTGNESRTSHSFSPVLPNEAQDGQTDTCTTCHTDLTRSYGQRFISNQQADVSLRMTRIEATLETTTAPQWVLDALAFIKGDGSLGVHNVPYTAALLNSMEHELGLLGQATIPETSVLADPIDCMECHEEEYNEWMTSPHANASLLGDFQEVFAENGQPSYCLRCHASGYDPLVGGARFAGVVCTSCHIMENGVDHPPAPISVASDAEICATCHSGGHASTYEEWLTSEHYAAGIDCIDCHTAHNNGLILEDVNATCADCHAEAMSDQVHMGADMQCTDCHMTPRQTVTDPTMLTRTGHSMMIDPGVCADCHGDTHLLSNVSNIDETSAIEIEALSSQITELETLADANLSSGLLGGAVGLLLVLGLVYLVLRLGRIK